MTLPKPSSPLLVAVCDAGAANYLAPALAGLPEAARRIYAQPVAARILRAAGLEPEDVPPCDWDDLPALGRRLIQENGPFAAALCGAAWGPSVCKAVLAAARAADLPCAGVVDHWEMYRERFSVVRDGRIVAPDVFLPDEVWLCDDVAVAEAEAAGLPAGRLRALGQPHLENRRRTLVQAPPPPRRADLLFVSQRIAGDYPTKHDEFSALTAAIRAAAPLGLTVRVKTHPQEPADKYADWPVETVAAGDAADLATLLGGAGRVVGMFSMLLLEAALIRDDVIAFLPEKGENFIGARVGAVRLARSDAELAALLAGAPPGPPCFGAAFDGSTARVAAAMAQLRRGGRRP